MECHDTDIREAKRLFADGWKADLQPGKIYRMDEMSGAALMVSIGVWNLMRAINYGVVSTCVYLQGERG